MQFNATEPKPPVSFAVVGWEQVRGTARRPQEAINELIGESHFLIVLFRDRWGSEPGSPWGYTSGTEEELFTSLLHLGESDRPMRDVWVAFLSHEAPADEIHQLRDQLSKKNALLYESIVDVRDLKQKLGERLRRWAPTVGVKVANHVDLLPSSGQDVLRAARLRLRGQKLVELGEHQAGLTSLGEAARIGGPSEHLAYAQQRARSGDLEGATASTQDAIDCFTTGEGHLHTPQAAEAFAAQAGIYRRQGRDWEAVGRLEHALTLVGSQDPTALKVRCRILDELGLAYQKLNDFEAARDRFEACLAARTAAGLAVDQAQSHINLARLEVASGEMSVALAHAESAQAPLRGLPPSALHANAEVLCAQLSIRTDRHETGVAHAERALVMNRQIANKRGEAISLLVLAQCYAGAGDDASARKHALACIDVNTQMGNQHGIDQATGLIDQLKA
jgi:tetratricopeptide (TPR) repeat protein